MAKTWGFAIVGVSESPLQEALQLWLLQKEPQSESRETLRSYAQVGREFVDALAQRGIQALDTVGLEPGGLCIAGVGAGVSNFFHYRCPLFRPF